ncbi:hypothetical protein J6590_090721 [Homalodisca vitripennis]|nr:hypothetical protein J6590_090721 [Homalodisca vitripennis]
MKKRNRTSTTAGLQYLRRRTSSFPSVAADRFKISSGNGDGEVCGGLCVWEMDLRSENRGSHAVDQERGLLYPMKREADGDDSQYRSWGWDLVTTKLFEGDRCYPLQQKSCTQCQTSSMYISVSKIEIFLNSTLNECIGCRGTIDWTARSPEPTPCDFSLWGIINETVSYPLTLFNPTDKHSQNQSLSY